MKVACSVDQIQNRDGEKAGFISESGRFIDQIQNRDGEKVG